MPEFCYTATQVKLVRASIVALMGVSIYQALLIRKLVKNLAFGKHRFDQLRDTAEYLLDIINEHNIVLTEFDLIALSAMTKDD